MAPTYIDDIHDVLNVVPFQSNLSLSYIKQHGNSLTRPMKNWVLAHKKFKSYDSRTLAFSALKSTFKGFSKLYGIVAGYRISYNSKYNQAAPYILLCDVCGLTYNNRIQYLTNHLWIDANLNMMSSMKNYQIGVGDWMCLYGTVEKYKGWVHHLPCYKLSLDNDTKIISCGYPYWHNHQLYIIKYQHQHYLLAIYGFLFRPKLGNEIRKSDVNYVNAKHLYIGYTADSILGHILNIGLHLRTRSFNPKLVVHNRKDKANLINHLSWKKMKKSIRIGSNKIAHVLTTAKALKNHPHLVYQQLHSELQPDLNYSLFQMCAWQRPFKYNHKW